MSPDQRLSPKAAAELADVSVDTIRRAYRSGELPAYYVGAAVRIVREDLDAWLARTPVQPATARPAAAVTAPRAKVTQVGSLGALRNIEQRRRGS